MSDRAKATETMLNTSAGTAAFWPSTEPSKIPFSRLVIAILFWALCLTLSAAGHRLYKETVALDQMISANTYQTGGVSLVWIGYGAVADSYERLTGDTPAESDLKLTVLPNSRFWLAAAVLFSLLGGMMAWSGRWISNTGIQSLVGLFAGHFLWLGAIEFGFDAAGRRLGLAGSLEVVGDRVVGTHAAGTFIQLSVVFLVPMLIGLTMHESNRCAVFQWFRKRLPIARTTTPSGRVENYAARTAIQFFMTVWFCYVSVLWLADPIAGKIGEFALPLAMLAIAIATPYMIWRTTRQTSAARALRYSVSGAVVTWTAIEIGASMHLFREPWLSTSPSSGLLFLGLSFLLTGFAARFLFTGGSRKLTAPVPATAAVAVLVFAAGGCSGPSQPEELTRSDIEQRLAEIEDRIEAPQAAAHDGLLHALVSDDPEMRAQAAIALGKSPSVSAVVRERLEEMANSDDSRLSQLAALGALDRLGLLSPELDNLRRKL